MCFLQHIVNPLLTELVWLWRLDIGIVIIYLAFFCAAVLKHAKKNLAISSFIIWLCLETISCAVVVHVSEQDSTTLPAGNCMLSLQEKFP